MLGKSYSDNNTQVHKLTNAEAVGQAGKHKRLHDKRRETGTAWRRIAENENK
jgi:hypothetical protein